jgi:hypothetical protein
MNDLIDMFSAAKDDEKAPTKQSELLNVSTKPSSFSI